MTSEVDDSIAAIRKIVVEHYEMDSTPLLLSSLGSSLKKQGIWPLPGTYGRSLRQIIEAANDPDVVIVRDHYRPAYIAVATGTTKSLVEERIRARQQAASEIPDLSALPRSVVLAFCQGTKEGGAVYLGKVPPFKYHLSIPDGEPPDQYFVIDGRYRCPMKISDIDELKVSDRFELQAKIAAWSRDNDVAIHTFYRAGGRQPSSALARLLAAQPTGVNKQIVIPGDIALLLSERE